MGLRALLPFLEKVESKREGREIVLQAAFPEIPAQLMALIATALLPNVIAQQGAAAAEAAARAKAEEAKSRAAAEKKRDRDRRIRD